MPAILIRAGLVAFGCLAVAWAAAVFPTFWREIAIDRVASRIVEGEQYVPGVLKNLTPALELIESGSWPRPSVLHNAAIVRLRMAEEAMGKSDQAAIDTRLTELDQTLRSALASSPDDAFLWLVLFWSENTRVGFTADNLRLLKMSYATGPNEGWIALRRNPLALRLYPQLSPDLAEAVVSEFVLLVRSGYYEAAARILGGPGWPVRATLLPRLAAVSDIGRRTFARNLKNMRIENVSIPGIEEQQSRPWR